MQICEPDEEKSKQHRASQHVLFFHFRFFSFQCILDRIRQRREHICKLSFVYVRTGVRGKCQLANVCECTPNNSCSSVIVVARVRYKDSRLNFEQWKRAEIYLFPWHIAGILKFYCAEFACLQAAQDCWVAVSINVGNFVGNIKVDVAAAQSFYIFNVTPLCLS